MTRKSFSRTVKLTTASFMAVLFGFPGVALADQASIRNTGPDSYNKIEFSDRLECEVENNNNVNAINYVDQNAQTGDAIVGGSGWHRYDPTAWAAQGHSYDEWESAVNAYMAQNKGNWKGNWGRHGGGNTYGGDATSGDATNISNNRTNISIDNSGACDFSDRGRHGGGSKSDKSKPGDKDSSKPGSVLGSSSAHGKPGKGGAGGHVLGGHGGGGGYDDSSMYGTSGHGGHGGGSVYYPTKSGGAGGGKGGDGHGGGGGYGGNDFSISKTGPDSYNKISYHNSSNTSVKNTNNVNVVNITKQSASSGNATVSGNTKAGSAGSGGAHNSSGSSTGAGIHN